MIPLILNASGCLDALTAPSVAERLDAFVTKTVTPLARDVRRGEGVETARGVQDRDAHAEATTEAGLVTVCCKVLSTGPSMQSRFRAPSTSTTQP